MRQILSISLEEFEIEYLFYLACFYNMTVSEYVRTVLREKWERDKVERQIKIEKPISFELYTREFSFV